MAVIILGIDPGLRATGWGAIRADGGTLSFLSAGTVSSDASGALCERLATLYRGLALTMEAVAPDEAAVEQTFVSRDGAATLKLGQARGIALLAPALSGVPVAEYAPSLVKKTVTGAGQADKTQIRRMVQMLLPRARAGSEHAWDALAVAVCHASHRRSAALRRVA